MNPTILASAMGKWSGLLGFLISVWQLILKENSVFKPVKTPIKNRLLLQPARVEDLSKYIHIS